MLKGIVKNIAIIVLVIGLVFASNTYQAFALNQEDWEQQPGNTEDELKLISEKLSWCEQFYQSFSYAEGDYIAKGPSDQLVMVTRNVPCEIQSTEYYCGPATVRNIVLYKNGTAQTQSTYASYMGTTTDGTDAPVVASRLNAEISGASYVCEENITSQSAWNYRVKASIDTNWPAALDIKVTAANQPAFGYTTIKGHFVAVRGYIYDIGSSTIGNVQISDPHYNYGGTKWINAGTLFSTTQAHTRKCVIW